MTEKISIFDVEISCIKAKEAMMQAIEFMKGDSVNTIELVSMESLMKESLHFLEEPDPAWKPFFSTPDSHVLSSAIPSIQAQWY